MERREEELIQQHLVHDEELRALYRQHVELKRRLDGFRNRLYLTGEQELEKRKIQKLKLASKDRLMAILSRYQEQPR